MRKRIFGAFLALGLLFGLFVGNAASASATLQDPPPGQTYGGSAAAGSHAYNGGVLWQEWDVTQAQLPTWFNTYGNECFYIGVNEAGPPMNDGQPWWVCMEPATPQGLFPLTKFYQDMQYWQQTTNPSPTYAQYRISQSPITHKYVYDAFHSRAL